MIENTYVVVSEAFYFQTMYGTYVTTYKSIIISFRKLFNQLLVCVDNYRRLGLLGACAYYSKW